MSFLSTSLKTLSSSVPLQRREPVQCDGKGHPEPGFLRMWLKGWAGSHDVPSLRRGYEVYRQVCATCHSMKYMKFRFLTNTLYPEARVKQIAAAYDVTDGPDDTGEMFQRPGITGDAFPCPYPNDEAAAYSNGGATPPDLSNFSACRHAGPDHIFAILTCYRDPPFGINLRAGLYYNTYFPGGALSMPPPLTDDGQVEYEDGTPSTISQMAWDVTQFITWATEPSTDERKLMGLKIMSGCAFSACFAGYWARAAYVANKTRRVDFTRVYM